MPRFGPEDLSRLDSEVSGFTPSDLTDLADALFAALFSGSPHAPNVVRAERLLGAMVRARRFTDAARLAKNLRLAKATTNLVLKLEVQALIDSGQLSLAEKMRQQALASVPAGEPERLELLGLGGRIYKQQYIDQFLRGGSAPPELLRQAVDEYLGAYEQHPARPIWHGINAVALLARARRDGVEHAASRRFEDIAKSISDRAPGRKDLVNASYWV